MPQEQTIATLSNLTNALYSKTGLSHIDLLSEQNKLILCNCIQHGFDSMHTVLDGSILHIKFDKGF